MATRLPITASEGASAALPPDGRRHAIQPADVRGRFARARQAVFALLILTWIGLPWVSVGGHPAFFADVAHRRLFAFGATFNAQDTWLLFFLLSGAGFGLVYVTALAGRVWCGWVCPQTVFLEGVYRRIERWIEGPRGQRIRNNRKPWTFAKAVRKGAKHVLFILCSVVVAHIFLSYFVSLPESVRMVARRPSEHPEAFAWAAAMTAVFYANFAWFREQLCVVLCPYGRLQSAMLDEHSLVVGYDTRRGEPRGKRSTPGAGDCVDCRRCVRVCPTGIDIRSGVQMECVACTACIDACDEVMNKLGRARGLIRYDSPDGLAGKPRHIVRFRTVLYTILLAAGVAVAVFSARKRQDFEAVVLRLPGAPYQVEGGQIRNGFQIHVVNKSGRSRSYRIAVQAALSISTVASLSTVALASLTDTRIPVFVSIPSNRFHGDFPLRLIVVEDEAETIQTSATFLGPTR